MSNPRIAPATIGIIARVSRLMSLSFISEAVKCDSVDTSFPPLQEFLLRGRPLDYTLDMSNSVLMQFSKKAFCDRTIDCREGLGKATLL